MILGIGTDIVEIERIKRMYEKRPKKTLNRIYGEREISSILSKKNPYPHLAVRFCAKEAFAKALGTGLGRISLTDFQVVNSDSGKPEACITGKARQRLEELTKKATGSSLASIEDVKVHISLSHSRELAVAYVTITKEHFPCFDFQTTTSNKIKVNFRTNSS